MKNLPTFPFFGGSGEADFIILKCQKLIHTEPKLAKYIHTNSESIGQLYPESGP